MVFGQTLSSPIQLVGDIPNVASAHSSLAEYYARRAPEYEKIYEKPERRSELRKLRSLVSEAFAGHEVLEIACGTGFWTQFIASKAARVTAIDCSDEVINLAKRKRFPAGKVSFQQCDAYSLAEVEEEYSAGFCGFWWSHIPRARVADFVSVFHSKLQDRAVAVLVDNAYVVGSSTPISRMDDSGNTYQIRRLDDGSEYEILKNFPTEEELIACLSPFATDMECHQMRYYWLARYSVRSGIEQPS